jgi:class 3 adenylate cyclase/tetratricopeptide (TPR) repeat protein
VNAAPHLRTGSQPAAHGFVSRLLTEVLVASDGAPQPAVRHLTGAVMLSDVAGFTTHVEAMNHRGPAGLERFARALDEYFVRLMAHVLEQGGDVVTIAGDAFFCVFPDADPQVAVRRAVTAALLIQRDLDGHAIADDRRFGTRIGIAAGDLSFAPLGGVGGQWHLVVTGSAVDEVEIAEHVVPVGRILVAPGAGRWLDGLEGVSASPTADGFLLARGARPPVAGDDRRVAAAPALADHLAAPYAPSFLRAPGGAVDPRWFAEFRQVAVGVTSMRIVLGDAADVATAHASIGAAQRILLDLGGNIEVAIDSKGLTVASLFGLPPTAHENDAERAVRAALRLQRELTALGVPASTGVTTGRAFCGLFGDRQRRQYAIAGNVINRAARLMEHADGGVLCDDAAVSAVRGRVQFTDLPPVLLRGLSASVAARVPRPERVDRVDSDRPMVGRADERARLRSSLHALLADGTGDTVVVLADAGLGKSRLLAAVGDEATRLEVPVHHVAGDAIDRSTSYQAWQPLFAALLRDEQRRPVEVARDLLAASPDLHELLPLLDAVVPIDVAEDARTAALTGDARAASTNSLLTRLVETALAGRPAVLLVDDAHWLDSLSWDLLRRVVHQVPSLLTVVGSRPVTDDADQLEQFAATTSSTQLVLDQLPDADVDELVRVRLGVSAVPADLAGFVRARCDGQPFFCEELLEAMLGAGTITVVDGRCVTTDLEASDVPSTVEGVIVARIDALRPHEQVTLKVAAVLGRSFDASALAAVHPLAVDPEEVAEHLAAFAAAALTERDERTEAGAHAFRHVLTRDTAYGMMTSDQRVHVHRAASAWYEERADATPAALIAHHCEHGLRFDAAVDHLERAANQALRAGSFREAVRSFDRATVLRERHDVVVERTRTALWDKGIGTGQYFLGDLSAARDHLQRAVAVLHRPIARDPRRAVGGLVREAALQVAHRARPRRYLERRADEAVVLDAAVDCYKILGQIAYLDGDPPAPLMQLTMAGLNIGEESGESANLASIMVNVGTLLDVAGAHRWGDWYSERAIAMAASAGTDAAGAYVHNINALMQGQRGRWDAALAANDRALQLLDAVGDDSLAADVWLTRSLINICAGAFDAAAGCWPNVVAIADRRENERMRCWGWLDAGQTLLGADDLDGAAAAWDEVERIPYDPRDGMTLIERHHTLAELRLRQGDDAAALANADAVVRIVGERPPSGFHWAVWCAAAAEVPLTVAGRTPAGVGRSELLRSARVALAASRKLARQFPTVRPRVHLLDGVLAWHEGNHERATARWLRALELAEQRDMTFERGRALLELGARGLHGGADALQEAQAVFTALGARHLAATAERG